MKCLLAAIFISIATFSCSLKENTNLTGIGNLLEKTVLLKINHSNKNDVVELLGESPFSEFREENTWLYGEILSKKNFFSPDAILKSNFVYLNFNNRGVLITKIFLDKKNFKDIKFAKAETLSKSLNKSSSKKLLNTLKKRYKNKVNTD